MLPARCSHEAAVGREQSSCSPDLQRHLHTVDEHDRRLSRKERTHHRDDGGARGRHARLELCVEEAPALAVGMEVGAKVGRVEAARQREGLALLRRQLRPLQREEGAASRHIDQRPHASHPTPLA